MTCVSVSMCMWGVELKISKLNQYDPNYIHKNYMYTYVQYIRAGTKVAKKYLKVRTFLIIFY